MFVPCGYAGASQCTGDALLVLALTGPGGEGTAGQGCPDEADAIANFAIYCSNRSYCACVLHQSSKDGNAICSRISLANIWRARPSRCVGLTRLK